MEYDDWEKHLYNATITASFLFVNNGKEEKVLMAMPLDISTPFIPNLYNYLEQDSTFNPGVVKVDGKEVEVKLLFYFLCSEWTFDDLNREEVSSNIDPLFKDQPEIGQGVYFRKFFIEIDKNTGHHIHNYINPEAALAYWEFVKTNFLN